MSKPASPRSKIRRSPQNADYQQSTLYAIIDDAYLCHIAFHDETGTHCLPMACWREDDFLYIHGSNGSRLMKKLADGLDVSIAISHLDGLVLARSAFNHSMNYRSCVIYGKFEKITAEADKMAALDAFMDKIAFGRKDEVRNGSKQEFGATIVLRISLAEAAAKVRSGPPIDDEKDMHIQAWTGVLPMVTQRLAPIAEEGNSQAMPEYVRAWGMSI